jgi:hypothetical protein
MPGVRPIGLRALLFALQTAGLRRLRQMGLSTDTLDLLDENRQPVVASNATSRSKPVNLARNLRTVIRSAGAILAREISPVIVSIHSTEICARC